MNRRILILLLALLATSAYAQNAPDGEVAEIRRYTVEMIVFSYAQDVSSGSEVFVAETPTITDMPEPLVSESKPAVRPVRRNFDFVRLAREDFTLNEAYERLRRLDVYKPLMHFGWTQSTFPKEDAVARPLSAYARPPAGLDGELTLYLSRFLHLAVDLKLDAPTTRGEPVRYHLNESRILRSGELRYFDHPKFGVLAKISRAED